MSESDRDEPVVEIGPGDVTIDGEAKVLVSVRVAEALKAALRLERELGGDRPRGAHVNYGCPLNYAQCGASPA